MTRGHRRAHAVLWLVIAPLLVAVLVLASRAGPQAGPGDAPPTGGREP